MDINIRKYKDGTIGLRTERGNVISITAALYMASFLEEQRGNRVAANAYRKTANDLHDKMINIVGDGIIEQRIGDPAI